MPIISKIAKMSVQLTITFKHSFRAMLTAVLHPALLHLSNFLDYMQHISSSSPKSSQVESQLKETLPEYDVGTKFFVSGHSSIFQRYFSHSDGMVLYVSQASTA